MFKKCFRSFLESMGMLAMIFMILSLILPDVMQIRFLYLLVCITAPIHLFSFFVFQLNLFSDRLWIRRVIVMAFSVCVMLAMNMLFGYLRFAADSLILYGVEVLLFVLLNIFVYYVADKIERRNLELINQKGIYYKLYKLQVEALKNIGIEG